MSNPFIPTARDQLMVIPVQEWLAEDHLARFIVEIVEGRPGCQRVGGGLRWGWLGALSTADDAGVIVLRLCHRPFFQPGVGAGHL